MYTPIDLSIDFVFASSNSTSNSSAQTGDVLSWIIMICACLLCLLAAVVFIRRKNLAFINMPIINSKTKRANHAKTSFLLSPTNKIFNSKLFIGFIVALLAILLIFGALFITKASADAQGGGSYSRHQQNYGHNRRRWLNNF